MRGSRPSLHPRFRARSTEHDVSGLNIVEHRFDELGLDLDMLILRRDPPIPLLDRPDGRSMRCSAIKVVDSK